MNIFQKKLLSPLLRNFTDYLWTNSPEAVQLRARIKFLENRLLGPNTFRADAVDKIAIYLKQKKVPGDYLAFGSGDDEIFCYAAERLHTLFPNMNFMALDNLDIAKMNESAADEYDLPELTGQNELPASPEPGSNLIDFNTLPKQHITVLTGGFAKTLCDTYPATAEIDQVAAAWFEDQNFESTLTALNFLTWRLSVGSALLFYGWRALGKSGAASGSQAACKEWLDQNSQLKLRELFKFSHFGQVFIVTHC